jgi:arabinogalactan oligomer / maltooligosaccharide transport system substrate-binding protein
LEAIMQFVDFLTNMDNQLDMIATLARLPALKEALGSELIQEDPILKGSAAQMQNGTPMPVVLEMRCNWDSMKPEMNAVLADQKSAEEAAEAMQQAADACVQAL